MINYSIFPIEEVFRDWDDFEPKFEEVQLNNNLALEVERLNSKEVRIKRLISSDPQYYLRQDLLPGTIVKSSLQI